VARDAPAQSFRALPGQRALPNARQQLFELGEVNAVYERRHDHYEETIYGIQGVLTWTVNGKRIDVGPGEALCIPRGAIHRFDNNGSQDVKAQPQLAP